MNKLLPNLELFLQKSPIVLAFVLPLLFLPLTTEYFETAKVAFLLLYGALLFLAWTLKMVLEKKVALVRSPLDKGLLIFAVALTLVSLLSGTTLTSLMGSYLRWQPSLPFTLLLVIYFYYLASSLKSEESRRNSLSAFVLSLSLACLLSLFSFFGLFDLVPNLPDYLKNHFFNPLGSSTSLSFLASLSLILALGLLKDEKARFKGVLRLSLYLFVATIFSYNQIIGYVPLALGLTLYFFFQGGQRTKLTQTLMPLLVWALLLTAFFSVPQITNFLKLNFSRPAEIALDPSTSWQIAAKVVTDRPLFGAGLGQFSQIFTLYKPLAFNSTNLWNIRFDRPFSDLFLFLSEAGLVGFLAFVFLLWSAVSYALRSRVSEPLYDAVRSAILASVVGFFLATGGSAHYFYFIFLLALLVAKEESTSTGLSERIILTLAAVKDRIFKKVTMPQISSTDPHRWEGGKAVTQVLPYLFLGAAVIGALLVVPETVKDYLGEYHNRQTLQAVARNDGRLAYNSLVASLNANPNLDVYQRNMAQIALGIAANISARPEVTDRDRQLIQGLIRESIQRVRIASEVLEPNFVVNWETRAQIYQNLINVAQNAEAWTVDAYARAIALDPFNPNLRLLLGGLYFGLGNYDLAAGAFSQAASLKSDLPNSHYNLAQALIRLNRLPEAINEYDLTLARLTRGTADYDRAQKERADLQEASNKAQAKPSASLSGQELNVATPVTNLKKKNVVPPEIDLGNPGKEATPTSQPSPSQVGQ